jgi:O-antigen ligase
LGLAAIALALVDNTMFVVTSRTGAGDDAGHAGIFLLLHLRWQVAMAAIAAAVLLVVATWYASPHLRTTVEKTFIDYRETMVQNNQSGMGSRLIYWGKSLRFFTEAPLIGHGTGSTRSLFEKAAAGEIGAKALVVSDPHNQTLNVAVQWGALRDVAGSSRPASRRGARQLDRAARGDPEHADVAAQLASVRFQRGLDLCAGRRHHRRHDAGPAR